MSPSKSSSRRNGFTLVEMFISMAIFTLIIVAFAGIFMTISNVGTQQSSSSAVGQESQALLQKIEYFVQTASVINIPTSTPTSTLQLFVTASTSDPTFVTLASGTVYLQHSTSGPLTALTSNKVTVSNLSFTRQSNPPGHDTVNVSFTMAYNTLNLTQSFAQLFQTSVVHVSAATFDTGVYASAANEPLGTAVTPWTPINGVIYTNGSNIGIGAPIPAYPLDVAGKIRSSSGGIIFPDGTTQATAAAPNASTTQNIVTASRAFNTLYTATSSPLFVEVTTCNYSCAGGNVGSQ